MAAPFHPPTMAPTPAPAAAPPPAPMAVRFPEVAQAARPARAIKVRAYRMLSPCPAAGWTARLSRDFKPRGCLDEFRQGERRDRHVGVSATRLQDGFLIDWRNPCGAWEFGESRGFRGLKAAVVAASMDECHYLALLHAILELARHSRLLHRLQAGDLRHVLIGHLAGDLFGARVPAEQQGVDAYAGVTGLPAGPGRRDPPHHP